MDNRCMGCMKIYDDKFDVCPHCGYVAGSPAEEAIHMEPGTLLHDRYIIGKVLGSGGFGITYIAWDGKLEQRVAIKEYLPGEFSTRMPGQTMVTVFSGDKSEQFRDGMKKFVDEAIKLAKFHSEPGIVKVLDSFEENSTAYIIMEYLEGETLTDFLNHNGTIEPEKAVSMLMPVMKSLQKVHENGILHRDIAPDNIFITNSGDVKLIDFGASRYATTSHSRSLTVIIKPGYSPEEQYRSKGDQGPYTDVYSLAATLYKMITGRTPRDAMERRAKYENDNKDILTAPHKLSKKITPSVDVALLNALNVRIEDRTQNIPEFIKELQAYTPAKRKYGKIKKIDVYMWPLWLKILTPSLLGLSVLFSVLMITNVIRFSDFTDKIIIPENYVVVPDVEGISAGEALEIIETGKLLASTGGTVESNYVTAGTIILQNPVGGSYKEINSTVLLTVSSGSAVISAVNGISTVPYVVWESRDEAVSKLKKAGLGEPVISEVYNENVEYGHVVSQSMEAGTEVDEGTSLKLEISLGPAPFEMPDVKNRTSDYAELKLQELGLAVTVEYGNDDSIEKDHVISQSVQPGVKVKRGDEIKLVISGGKETVKVSDVVSKSRNDAVSILKEQGFKVTVLENYDSMEAGKVISQNPKGGSSQLKGTEIVITVSKGPQPDNSQSNSSGNRDNKTENDESSSANGNSKPSDTTFIIDYYSDNGSHAEQKSLRNGELYNHPEPGTKKYHTFKGWYTEINGNGTRIENGETFTINSNQKLYAYWIKNQESDWVEISKVPEGAEITAHKWKYKEVVKDGEWIVSGDKKIHLYADFPEGFDQTNGYYSQFEKSQIKEFENAGVSKRTASFPEHYTYIYWHYNSSADIDSRLGDYSVAPIYNSDGSSRHFAAHIHDNFHSNSDGNKTQDGLFFCDEVASEKHHASAEDKSYWWYRTEVMKQEYYDYTWKAPETKDAESDKIVTAGGKISDVKEFVKYIPE